MAHLAFEGILTRFELHCLDLRFRQFTRGIGFEISND
jgi:hypothetical protein